MPWRTLPLLWLAAVLAGSISAAPIPELAPLRDGGFEQGLVGDGQAWGVWVNNGAGFTWRLDRAERHGGAQSLFCANTSGVAPHVYGRVAQEAPVLPGVPYVLSAWVKGQQVGDGLHFTDWQAYTLAIPAGTYDWRKVEVRFTTGPDQRKLAVGLNVVNVTAGLWVDDVRLEPQTTPLRAMKGTGVSGAFWAAERVEGDGLRAAAWVLAEAPPGAVAVLTAKAGTAQASRTSAPLPAGRLLELAWQTGTGSERVSLELVVQDAAGRTLARAERSVAKYSQAEVQAGLSALRAALPALQRRLNALAAKGVAVDYPRVSISTLERFLPWAAEDVAKGELRRATQAVGDLAAMAARAGGEIAALERNPRAGPRVVRYRTGPLGIEGTHFVGNRRGSDGRVGRGPVFFCGYGHFGAVRRDIEWFPSVGVNIIQIEMGPNSVFPSEHEVRLDGIREIEQVLDRAAKANVVVNLLISPHYFPDWARQKWPEVNACKGGFFTYCLDHAGARGVMARYLRLLIPAIKGKPALHSICLSNEPMYTDTAACPLTRQLWAKWLEREHGDIATLNARLRTTYPALDQVPIPGNNDYDAPQFLEWVLFNNERFAGFHRFLADVIHEMAPELPVHAKMMAWTPASRAWVAAGVDTEQFGAFGQISGNDCLNFYPDLDGRGPDAPAEWTSGCQLQNWFYDLQRTMCRQPIFNSENHLSPDRSAHYIPGGHFGTALWQGAIHGQGATTLWVWERTFDPKSDFYGSVMHRPGGAEAVGRTCLDLMRLAREVAAFQAQRPAVALLYSIPSAVRSPRYLDWLQEAYAALNAWGLHVAFVSERQVAAGDFGGARLLVLPGVTTLTDEAFAGIERFAAGGGRLFLYGDRPAESGPGSGSELAKVLAFDRFGRERDPGRVAALHRLAQAATPSSESMEATFRRLYPDLQPALRLEARGLETRVAELDGRLLLNAVNYLSRPVTATLLLHGKPVTGMDLVSRRQVGPKVTLPPLTPMLLEIRS